MRRKLTDSTKFTEVDEDHVILIDLCPPYILNMLGDYKLYTIAKPMDYKQLLLHTSYGCLTTELESTT